MPLMVFWKGTERVNTIQVSDVIVANIAVKWQQKCKRYDAGDEVFTQEGCILMMPNTQSAHPCTCQSRWLISSSIKIIDSKVSTVKDEMSNSIFNVPTC